MANQLGFTFVPLPRIIATDPAIAGKLNLAALRLLILFCSQLRIGKAAEWSFSLPDLMAETGCSRPTVKVAIDQLVALGWLERSAGPGPRGYVYRLMVEAFDGDQTLTAGGKEGGKIFAPPFAPPKPSANKERADAPDTMPKKLEVLDITPLPPASGGGVSKAKAPLVEIPQALDTKAFREAWDSWQADRRDRKKPVTPRAQVLQLAKLAQWGEARAIAAIEASIAAGWQGIFEPSTSRAQPVPVKPKTYEDHDYVADYARPGRAN